MREIFKKRLRTNCNLYRLMWESNPRTPYRSNPLVKAAERLKRLAVCFPKREWNELSQKARDILSWEKLKRSETTRRFSNVRLNLAADLDVRFQANNFVSRKAMIFDLVEATFPSGKIAAGIENADKAKRARQWVSQIRKNGKFRGINLAML